VSAQVTKLSKGVATRLADVRAIRIVHQQVIDQRRNLAEGCAALQELAHEYLFPRLLALVGCAACVGHQAVVLREAVDFAQLGAVVGERVLVQEILKLVWASQFGDQAFLLVQHLDEAVVGLYQAIYSFRIEGKLVCAGLAVRRRNR
jgi:hypothetical protein